MKLFYLVALLVLSILIVTTAFLLKTRSVAPTKSTAAPNITIEYDIAYGADPKQKQTSVNQKALLERFLQLC